MTNLILLRSSIVCSIIHVYIMSVYPPPLLYGLFINIGLLTSICNHGLTSYYWRWSDRIIMAGGSGITIYLAPSNSIRGCVVLLGILYGLSKRYNTTIFHVIAHGLLTYINTSILYNLSHIWSRPLWTKCISLQCVLNSLSSQYSP